MKIRFLNWQVLLGLALVVLSAAVYVLHFVIFRDIHHIMIYLIGDVAFVFIEVLLVTIIIHQLLGMREKRAMLKKMYMVIGVFFNEVGTQLLTTMSRGNPHHDEMQDMFKAMKVFSDKNFIEVRKKLQMLHYTVEGDQRLLEELKSFLLGRRDFLLRLLENPNLLEHDSFTNLLWAVFHLMDELDHRRNISTIPAPDTKHLIGDVQRAYQLLIAEWLDYMRHLKESYPYLFSLAMRTNPFDPHAAVEVV